MAEARKRPFVINDEPRYDFVHSTGRAGRRIKRTKIPKCREARQPSTKNVQKTDREKSPVPEVNPELSVPECVNPELSVPECSYVTSDVLNEHIVDDNFTYMQLLTTHLAVTPVDEGYRAFLLQDIDTDKKRLKDEYVIVQRRVVETAGNALEWLYGCSCNPARQRMVDVLSSKSAEKDFGAPYQKCRHINAMENLATGLNDSLGLNIVLEFEKEKELRAGLSDDHAYGKYVPEVTLYGLESSDRVVCVRFEEPEVKTTYSLVLINFKGKKPILRCMSCKKEGCKHVNAVLQQETHTSDLSSHVLRLLNQDIKWRSRYVPVPVSSQKIPFTVAPEEQKSNRAHLVSRKSDDGLIHLIPTTEGFCSCGAIWDDESESLLEEVPLLTPVDILCAKVYIRKCSNTECSQTKDYDGHGDQLLNMGTYLISHQILRSYLRQFVTEGTTLSSYYKELCWQQRDSGNLKFSDVCSYNRLRYSWYAFVTLLDADYSNGFVCPECGENPETVVMDGITLGIRKEFLPWKEHLKSKLKPQTLDGSSHNSRVFINNAQTRKRLQKYTSSGLSETEFVQLSSDISLYQPSLQNLMHEFHVNGASNKCPDIYVPILKCLSSNSPVCGLLHYNERLFEVLNEMSIGVTICDRADDIILVEQSVPILSSLFRNLDWNIPDYVKPIIAEIVQKAKEPFNLKPHNIPKCTNDCDCSGIGYFPGLPKLCHRGDYVLDDRTKTVVGNCSKSSPRHASLTPGVFTLSCIHGVCYGFQLMENVESPNTPFTILRTRFHTAPKMIIYDNACNLHNYCLNRDPVFFRDTWFVVDRFHWFNHIGCHKGYNLSEYFQFNYVNTQVAEQRNSTLKKLKSMLSYMNHDNFINHLKLFVWFRSMISIVKFKPDLASPNIGLFKDLCQIYSKIK